MDSLENQTNANTKRRKRQDYILKGETTKFVFTYPILLFLLFLIYTINLGEINITTVLIIPIFIFIHLTYERTYSGKKLYLTNKKIYIYEKGEKIISKDIVYGLKAIHQKSTKISSLLNYGTLHIEFDDDTSYTYSYLDNMKFIYDKILEVHLEEVRKNIPDYKLDGHNELDNIDKIDKIN